MPDQFWGLTVDEFWLKWNAFAREEDRRRALVLEAAAFAATDQTRADRLYKNVNALRRYPLKQWLLLK